MNYNLILYIGIIFILIGFIGFIICEIRIAQLDKSFKNADKTNERKYKNTY